MIYFIQNTGTGQIKIGTSGDPTARLRTLQTASPARLVILATEPGGITEEAALHRQFAAARTVGEWFAPTAALLQRIAATAPQVHTAGLLQDVDITVTCQGCHQPTAPGAATVHVSLDDARAHRAWEHALIAEGRSPNSLAEIQNAPGRGQWHVTCDTCLTSTSHDCAGCHSFPAKDLTTWARLIIRQWALSREPWFNHTNWAIWLTWVTGGSQKFGLTTDRAAANGWTPMPCIKVERHTAHMWTYKGLHLSANQRPSGAPHWCEGVQR